MINFGPTCKIFTGYILVLIMLIACSEVNAQTTDTTYTFTNEEVVQMDSLFQVYEQKDSINQIEIGLLEIQIGNYKQYNQHDSTHIMFLNEKITLLDQRIIMYQDLTKQLEPKWYNAPRLHFVLGIVSTVVIIHTMDYALPR
jgi:hypothetical protein